MSMQLDTHKSYALLECLRVMDHQGEWMILDTRSYTLHELNESASCVARLADGEHSCEQMVAQVLLEYGCDLRLAAEVVFRSLQLLSEQGLLRAV